MKSDPSKLTSRVLAARARCASLPSSRPRTPSGKSCLPWNCPAPAGPRDGQPTLPTPRASRAPVAEAPKPYPARPPPSESGGEDGDWLN
jgi:hypothetical protein